MFQVLDIWLYKRKVPCWRVTCNSSGVTVTTAIASTPTESSVSQAQVSRAHPKAQPQQSHSFAHVLKEGLNMDKQESKDTPKAKKAPQQSDGKDGGTSSSKDTENTAVTKPITGKFGFPSVPSDAKQPDSKTVNAEAGAKTLDTKAESSSGNAQAAGLPASPVSGTPGIKNGNAMLMAMLGQSRLGALTVSHGTKNDALLAGLDLANLPALAPSLATLAAVQNAASSPASSAAGAGAEKPHEASNSQSLPDATASSDGSTVAAATAVPGHLAFALRLSAGTLNSQSHTALSADAASPAQSVSAASAPSAPAVAMNAASSEKREEQGSDAPPQHERSATDAVVQASSTQASQSDTALPNNETQVRAPATELDDKLEDGSTEPVRNVNMQVIGEGNRRVNIALLDRSGELRVSVHSADTGLNQKLQDKMPELTSQLEGQRYDTEVWMPRRQNSDGQNQDDSKQQDRPNWVEELQHTSGNPGRNQSTWLQ